MGWRRAVQLGVLVLGCDAEPIGNCYPTRLCGFTVKLFVDARCSAQISQKWVEPGSCTGDVLLGLKPALEDSRPDGFDDNLGSSASIGDVYSVGGIWDSYLEGIGFWKSLDSDVTYPNNASMLCGGWAPTLYLSDKTKASYAGKQDDSQCVAERKFLRMVNEDGTVTIDPVGS